MVSSNSPNGDAAAVSQAKVSTTPSPWMGAGGLGPATQWIAFYNAPKISLLPPRQAAGFTPAPPATRRRPPCHPATRSQQRRPRPRPGPAALLSFVPAWHRERSTVSVPSKRISSSAQFDRPSRPPHACGPRFELVTQPGSLRDEAGWPRAPPELRCFQVLLPCMPSLSPSPACLPQGAGRGALRPLDQQGRHVTPGGVRQPAGGKDKGVLGLQQHPAQFLGDLAQILVPAPGESREPGG